MVGITTNQIPHLRLATDADTHRMQSRSGPAAFAQPTSPGGIQVDSLALSTNTNGLPDGLLKGPPVNRELVSQLGAAIAEGRYPIDPAAIAEAMCRDFLDLSS